MKKIISSGSFVAASASFFANVAVLLSVRAGVQISSISTPQNVACYQVDDGNINLRLRLVLIPLTSGQLLGRLSWLDWRGIDHVCCYVNEAFDCLVMVSNGVWKKRQKSAEVLCLKQFESLIA